MLRPDEPQIDPDGPVRPARWPHPRGGRPGRQPPGAPWHRASAARPASRSPRAPRPNKRAVWVLGQSVAGGPVARGAVGGEAHGAGVLLVHRGRAVQAELEGHVVAVGLINGSAPLGHGQVQRLDHRRPQEWREPASDQRRSTRVAMSCGRPPGQVSLTKHGDAPAAETATRPTPPGGSPSGRSSGSLPPRARSQLAAVSSSREPAHREHRTIRWRIARYPWTLAA